MKICSKCETSNSPDSAFCINCGVLLEITTTEQPVESDSTNPKVRRGKLIGSLCVVALVGLIVGVLITANGLAKPVIGVRYTESELMKVVDFSLSKGYEDGQTEGYNSGKDDGYRTGYSDGCNNVFDEVGYTEIVGIFYPYNGYSTGKTYYDQSYLCD
jgi:hypothetical protein